MFTFQANLRPETSPSALPAFFSIPSSLTVCSNNLQPKYNAASCLVEKILSADIELALHGLDLLLDASQLLLVLLSLRLVQCLVLGRDRIRSTAELSNYIATPPD